MVVTDMSPTADRRERVRHELWSVVPAALLTLLMVWSVVQSVINANWADGTGVLISVVLPAIVVGVIFARLTWLPPWLAHLLSGALGLVWSIQRLGPLLGERLPTWRDQATELIIRVIMWSRVLANGGRGEDIILFVAALSLLTWILGYATAWMIFRRNWTWFAVFINAVTILVNYTFVLPKPTGLFFTFLGSALLLVVFENIVHKQRLWRDTEVEFPDFLSLRFVSAAALFCGAIVIFTGLLPNTISNVQVARAWKTMSRPLTEVRERWEDAFSTINAPPGTGGGGFATRGAVLGGPRSLSDTPVMYVETTDFDYWRAIASDKYTGRGWQNTTGEEARATLGQSSVEAARTPLEPGVTLPTSDIKERYPVTQTIELLQDRKDDFVVVGGQAESISLPTLIEHNFITSQGSAPEPNFTDTSIIISQLPLQAGGVYSVTALMSFADEQSLRNAGVEYPDWVRQRYLQLPDTITDRTRAKALEVVQAAGAENAYDITLAIQNYLRTFPYNQNIEMAPGNQDVVDYFLFDRREGYCDYYATSMVVMLRTLGVPARWVQGYAGGVYDSERQAYLVRENIAHSWPEVYFPGFGWQRFEPTPASYTSMPLRPATPSDEADQRAELGSRNEPIPSLEDGNSALPSDEDELRRRLLEEQRAASEAAFAQRQQQELVQRIALIIGLLALVSGGVGIFLWRRDRQLRALGPAAGAFARLEWLGNWAGLPHHPEVTAHEYGAELNRALPEQRLSVQRIVDAYVANRYHNRQPDDPDQLDVDLKQVRGPLIKRMLNRIGPPKRGK